MFILLVRSGKNYEELRSEKKLKRKASELVVCVEDLNNEVVVSQEKEYNSTDLLLSNRSSLKNALKSQKLSTSGERNNGKKKSSHIYNFATVYTPNNAPLCRKNRIIKILKESTLIKPKGRSLTEKEMDNFSVLKCNVCSSYNGIYILNAGNGNSLSSCKNHLETKHYVTKENWENKVVQFEDIMNKNKKIFEEGDISKNTSKDSLPSNNDYFMANKYSKFSKTDNDHHINGLIQWIVDDFIKISIVENKKFQKFVYGLESRFEMPSRYHIGQKLDSLQMKGINDFRELIEREVKYFHSSIDFWTSISNKAYIGFTLQWLNKLGDIKSLDFLCRMVPYPHNEEKIEDTVKQIADEFEFSDILNYMVSDGIFY